MKPTFQAIAVPIGRPDAGPRPPQGSAARPEPAAVQTPSIDIYEGPDGLVLEADLPGVAEKDLAIQVEDNVLSLKGRAGPPASEGLRVLHEEYRLGEYYRSFILSDEVDRTRITADFRHGVLRLVLPRAERSKTRKIEIQGG